MSEKTKPEELTQADLDGAQGGIISGPLVGSIKDLEAQDRVRNHEILMTTGGESLVGEKFNGIIATGNQTPKSAKGK